MRSMTGFGQAAGENDNYRIEVTLRSVNHRYLDLALRLPAAHRDKEAGVRKVLAGRIDRGRVDARLDIQHLVSGQVRVALDHGVIAALHQAVEEMAAEGLLEKGFGLSEVARISGALRVESLPARWQADDQQLLERLVGEALDELSEAREREGASLAASLRERLLSLTHTVKEIDGSRQIVQQELHLRLQKRLSELLSDAELPEERLLQEAAVLAERSDIQEEIDRLTAHLEQFQEHLAESGPVGRRLDFLVQEMFRELNTLAAKCRDTSMIRQSLEAKALCEQLREQLQNVE